MWRNCVNSFMCNIVKPNTHFHHHITEVTFSFQVDHKYAPHDSGEDGDGVLKLTQQTSRNHERRRQGRAIRCSFVRGLGFSLHGHVFVLWQHHPYRQTAGTDHLATPTGQGPRGRGGIGNVSGKSWWCRSFRLIILCCKVTCWPAQVNTGGNFCVRWLNWWWKIVMKTKHEMGKWISVFVF